MKTFKDLQPGDKINVKITYFTRRNVEIDGHHYVRELLSFDTEFTITTFFKYTTNGLGGKRVEFLAKDTDGISRKFAIGVDDLDKTETDNIKIVQEKTADEE